MTNNDNEIVLHVAIENKVVEETINDIYALFNKRKFTQSQGLAITKVLEDRILTMIGTEINNAKLEVENNNAEMH